ARFDGRACCPRRLPRRRDVHRDRRAVRRQSVNYRGIHLENSRASQSGRYVPRSTTTTSRREPWWHHADVAAPSVSRSLVAARVNNPWRRTGRRSGLCPDPVRHTASSHRATATSRAWSRRRAAVARPKLRPNCALATPSDRSIARSPTRVLSTKPHLPDHAGANRFVAHVLAVAKRAPEQVRAVFLTFDGFLDGDDVGSAGSF